MHSLSERAVGRWRGVLTALGVDPANLKKKNGPCPMCDGKDRWTWDDKEGRGTWHCRRCGAGDGIALVMRIKGVEFRDAARLIEAELDDCPIETPKPAVDPVVLRRKMANAWLQAGPLTACPPVVAWWKGRGLPVSTSDQLRAALNPRGGVMLARVTDADGNPVQVHRTYVQADGRPADMDSHRLLMEGLLPKGSAVRLSEPSDVLGIAEGIETAQAASLLHGVPVWAALTAGNLEAFTPPPGVRLIVFGDVDDSFTGQAAAYTLAKRLRSKRIDVDVKLPARGDWNDVAQGHARAKGPV